MQMKQQHFEAKNDAIRERFLELKRSRPECLATRLNLSWSNWGFGLESLVDSAKRLERAGLKYIELHGNHYGPDLGYKIDETRQILGDHGLSVSGVCGMFSAENDMASNRASVRQAAIDYIRRELAFTQAVGGTYLLVVPGAVGRPKAYDEVEHERSVQTLQYCAPWFIEHKVHAAVEPIRAAEVSFVHTIVDAKRYISDVRHPGIAHINGDVYHMQSEESHVAEALRCRRYAHQPSFRRQQPFCSRPRLHRRRDHHSRALRDGVQSAGSVRHVRASRSRRGSLPAMYGKPDKPKLDALVGDSIRYFRDCEEMVLAD